MRDGRELRGAREAREPRAPRVAIGSDARVVAVVPALDEAPRIGAVVAGLLDARIAPGGPAAIARVVVVDDGSADGTAEAALATGDPRVEVVRHARPRGVGAAIARGYRRAVELDADAAVVLAGDGQMDPADLPALLAPLRDGGADYVQGDRLAWHGGAAAFPLDRFLGVLGLALATRLATGLDVRDAQCGYTAIGRRALDALDALDAPDALDGARSWQGYGYPNDVLLRLARRGLRVVHVPVRPIYAGAPSKLGWRHLPPILTHLARATLARASGRAFGASSASGARAAAAELRDESRASRAREGWRADAARGSAAPCA